jgi:hypothetical protein
VAGRQQRVDVSAAGATPVTVCNKPFIRTNIAYEVSVSYCMRIIQVCLMIRILYGS